MSRFLPDLSPLFKQIVRIADALEGIDKSLARVVEIIEQPVTVHGHGCCPKKKRDE